ncbi:MAG TPA: PqqD family protein [Trichormus sp.]|jgi:hypothetical protein
MSDSSNFCPLARQNEILAHDVGNEVVIYDLKDDKAFCLNRVAAKVWRHCDGQTPVSTLAGLLEEFDLPADPTAVLCVLDQLGEYGLIQDSEKKVATVTRRQVLGRLGVAAAAVAACVTAITVPTALHAQSGGPTAG